jgi:hypothetical protein
LESHDIAKNKRLKLAIPTISLKINLVISAGKSPRPDTQKQYERSRQAAENERLLFLDQLKPSGG